MKRWMVIFGVTGVLLMGSWAFSQEGTSNGTFPLDSKWWGFGWHYCRKVNPDSENCRQMLKMMKEHWQKMQTVRERIRREMKEYCQRHHEEPFCQDLRSGKKRPCPRPCCRGGRVQAKRHRMRMEGC